MSALNIEAASLFWEEESEIDIFNEKHKISIAVASSLKANTTTKKKKILSKDIKQAERLAIDAIKHYYLNDPRPFGFGFSGGKDSTVAVDLGVKALMEIPEELRTKQVYVQFSDTGREMGNSIEAINRALNRLELFAINNNLPIVIKRVHPIKTETFLVLFLGKGYQLYEQRWCTDRLKIRPQVKLLKELSQKHSDGIIAVVGTRAEESAERKNRLADREIDGMLKTHDTAKWNLLAPIEDWSTNDIWAYIYSTKSEWVNADELDSMYEDASDDGDECKTMLEGTAGEVAGCGKSARYGCDLCPKVYSKDKALHNLAKKYTYMEKIEVYRNWLMEEALGWKNRRVYRNDNQGRKLYNREGKNSHRVGMAMPSGYTIEFRKEALKRLWIMSEEIKEEKGSPFITYDELVEIQKIWIKEEGDYNNLSVMEITGVNLIDDLDMEFVNLCRDVEDYFTFDILKKEQGKDFHGIPYVKIQTSQRFVSMMTTELLKTKSHVEVLLFVEDIMNHEYYNKSRNAAHKEFMLLRVYTSKFFPTQCDKEIIRQEWDDDQISFNTYMDNNLYEGVVDPESLAYTLGEDFSKEYVFVKEKYSHQESLHKQYKEYQNNDCDITACESISLADKMAYFDNW